MSVQNAVLEAMRKEFRERSADEIQEYVTRKVIEQGVTSIEWIEDERLRNSLLELDKIQKELRS